MIELKITQVAQSNMSLNQYDVKTNHKKVLDFINEVVSDKREWGTINIHYEDSNHFYIVATMEYKWGVQNEMEYTDEKFKELLLNGYVKKVTAIGAWTNMNYNVYLKGN